MEDTDLEQELRTWVTFPGESAIHNSVHYGPRTLAEMNRHVGAAMMNEALFGNVISQRLEYLRKQFVDVIIQQYGEFPSKDYEKYELKGESAEIGRELWIELIRPRIAEGYR